MTRQFIKGVLLKCTLIGACLKVYRVVKRLKMAALKFTGIICLVYFTILANAGKKRNDCEKMIEKLDTLSDQVGRMDCSNQGIGNCLFPFCLLQRFKMSNIQLFQMCNRQGDVLVLFNFDSPWINE